MVKGQVVHTTKAVDVSLDSSAWALDGGEWSTLCSLCCTPGVRACGTHWVGAGWVLELFWMYWRRETCLVPAGRPTDHPACIDNICGTTCDLFLCIMHVKTETHILRTECLFCSFQLWSVFPVLSVLKWDVRCQNQSEKYKVAVERAGHWLLWTRDRITLCTVQCKCVCQKWFGFCNDVSFQLKI